MPTSLPVLEYLRRHLADELDPDDSTWLCYPTPVSRLLGMRIVDVAEQAATLRMEVTIDAHGNQQGTVHGGTIAELADAAIGTAHSTVIGQGESFATVELTVRYFRPVWKATLTASASAVRQGRTISHYRCEIRDEAGRVVAVADSSVMTLREEAARERAAGTRGDRRTEGEAPRARNGS